MKKNTTSERVSFTDGYKAPDNAQAVKENSTAGINRIVKLSAIINGEIISSFKHFKLKQSAVTHHEFELTLAHDALPERQGHQLEEANAFLGKRLTIKITYKDVETKSSPERVFVGIITKVGFSQEAHSLGNIVLKGFSPTILLDGAPHTQSFGGAQPVNTGIIADEVIKQGIDPFWYDFRVNAKASSQIVYSSQYSETHYNYLCRLAEAYGEQFYYDGEVLHFGNMPTPAPPLELISGSNASNIHTELRALHTQPGYYGYNSSKNTMLTSGETPIKHMGNLAKTSYANNESIFKTPSLQSAPIRAATDMDVVNSQTAAWGSKGVDVFVVSGDTTMPFLYPGCTADLYLRKPDSNKTGYFTKLMMTQVTHEIDTLGHYKGSFEAIASDTGYMPKPEFTVPFAEIQPAVVISNEDPLGQGRVQVKFLWQLNETTDFIRVMSPDAGGTGQITQNRGFVAIPEVGDQVMVGFVHNHPDRPFVMGGMFHGGVALGGGIENKVRSFQNKDAQRIILTEGTSIILADKSGNEILIDTAGKNITITAPETITLNCKNMNINVGENMTTSIGNNQSTTVEIILQFQRAMILQKQL
ncbi:phage baseplate assembly protein V [Chryseobacterium tructae]|uniref:type VI secretion system Vgr family protein n=1 Tax=Chryseobacterium tructae TaxID=1037380 RepID=UPI0025B4AFFE|nr:phage baseplate assembly protein V [Chryseobacterium tructae]MDN3692985.1 phage baseplate assembly protein V [Chryseobacterium tructae]